MSGNQAVHNFYRYFIIWNFRVKNNSERFLPRYTFLIDLVVWLENFWTKVWKKMTNRSEKRFNPVQSNGVIWGAPTVISTQPTSSSFGYHEKFYKFNVDQKPNSVEKFFKSVNLAFWIWTLIIFIFFGA